MYVKTLMLFDVTSRKGNPGMKVI